METHPIPETSGVPLETFALRGLAFMLAPLLFVSVFGIALVSLPAAALRWALSR